MFLYLSAIPYIVIINTYALQEVKKIDNLYVDINSNINSNEDSEMFILEGTKNTRYLEIFKNSKGYKLKKNSFFRSDNTDKLTEKDISRLRNAWVKTALDLRYLNEISKSPDRLSKINGITYYNLTIPVNRRYPLYDSYVKALECKSFIKNIFETISSAQEGIILFHCTYGKDRTGILSMLLLGLVDIPVEDITKNYCTCYCYNEPCNNEDRSSLYKSSEELISRIIKYILDKYESFYNYLLSCNISPQDLLKIKEKLIYDNSSV